MLTFNNDNIFTGYLKQLLATFNLPKFIVYTQEQQNFAKNYKERLAAAQKNTDDSFESVKKELQRQLKNNLISKQEYDRLFEEIRQNWRACTLNNEKECKKEANLIVSTKIHNKVPSIEENWELNKYPQVLNYTPYIKDNLIQYYLNGAWYDSHIGFEENLSHYSKVHKDNNNKYRTQYVYNKKYRNWTKNLTIKNNIYDSYTHEYLGDYLRFHRDYTNLDLMPLYNCFSNRLCSNLNIKIELNGYTAKFNSLDNRYKIYMVPIKFFKDYTFALSSEYAIEMFCGSFDQYLNDGKQEDLEEELLARLIKKTYCCFNYMQFNKPELYTKLNDFLNELSDDELSKLSLFEDTLKLFIKVPVNNKSSLVILEGNYTAYAKSYLSTTISPTTIKQTDEINTGRPQKLIIQQCTCGNTPCTCVKQTTQKTNHIAINLDGNLDNLSRKLITPLQLLRTDTGTSYPFADRLIEYLIGNNITHLDDIADNTKRVNIACKMAADGIVDIPTISFWNDSARVLFYNFINKKHDTFEINHDILGYVDKDVENLFSFKIDNTKTTTLAQTDIYEEPAVVRMVENYE